MSDHDEVMERLDWLVEAVKGLLKGQLMGAATLVDTPSWPPTEDANIGSDELDEDAEVAAMMAQVQDTPPPRCPHQHQKKEGRNIVCAKCGDLLIAGAGIVDTSQGQTAPWLADKDRRG